MFVKVRTVNSRRNVALLALLGALLLAGSIGVFFAFGGGGGGDDDSSSVAVDADGGDVESEVAGSHTSRSDDDEVASTTAAETTTTAPTTTIPPTTTTTQPPRTATIAFTGDILPHGSVVERARANASGTDLGWDFSPMFDLVRPQLSAADLAICHLESPLSPDNGSLSSYPAFNAPRTLADAIAGAGYDGCSLASNHTYDKGRQGVLDTATILEEAGLTFAGSARTEAEDNAPVLYEVNGITVGHLSATYDLNGFVLPEEEPWLVDLIEPQAIIEEAEAVRAAGADVVVLSLHWGDEYRHDPTDEQLRWLQALLPDADVDVVIGHHAHVVQPVDKVGDEWVVFGLGNFVSNQSASCCVTASQDGMIATITLNEPTPGEIVVSDVSYTPTWVDRSSFTIVPVEAALAGEVETGVGTSTLQSSLDRSTAVVESRLGAADGLTRSK